TQRNDSKAWGSQAIKKFDKPLPGEKVTVKHVLDLPAMDLKAGDQIHYRAEACDRKGQIAKSAEFVVRIQADGAASDQLLANYEKNQEDPFRDKLVKLISEQAKIQKAMEKLSVDYAPLNEKLKAARLAAEKVTMEAVQKAAAKVDPKQP